MSSRFNFSQHCVPDIDDICNSFHPLAVKSVSSTPTTSLSPHTNTPFQLSQTSQLTISIDTAPPNNTKTTKQEQEQEPVIKTQTSSNSLQLPSLSDSDSIHSSPLISEPSPKPASYPTPTSPLTLNPLIAVNSIKSPLQIQREDSEPINPLYPTYSYDNLTPLYTAQILENPGLPDLFLPDSCIQTTTNKEEESDSDYDFESDLILNQEQIQIDIEFESALIKMGTLCCSDHEKVSFVEDAGTPKQSHLNMGNKVPSSSKDPMNGQQIKILVNHDTNSKLNDFEDDIPPIPKDGMPDENDDNGLSLLETKSFHSIEEEQEHEEEDKDIVSPIDFNPPKLDYNKSATNQTNYKRPSASALSSPLHSVRLSITPKGHLAPIHLVDNSSDYEDDDDDESFTESKEDDKDDAEYGTIQTPVPYLHKHQTITKFVHQSQQSNTSEKNVLSRRKRRQGISERHTLTFSKPPLSEKELPQSPKFAEIDLDVSKPREFLYKILKGNLLFSGVDAEFAEKMVVKVVDLMKAADFQCDEILMHQGAEGDAFYAVEYGTFDILVTNEQIKEHKVAIATKGMCVGEYALLYNQPRTATLKATTKCRVWGITAEQFAEMRQEIMDWNVERFEKRQEFIHSIALFQKLEQHELLNMTHACHAEIYDINEYIIKPHSNKRKKNTNVYIIMEGTVTVSYDKVDSDGNNKSFDLMNDGHFDNDISHHNLMDKLAAIGGSDLRLNLSNDNNDVDKDGGVISTQNTLEITVDETTSPPNHHQQNSSVNALELMQTLKSSETNLTQTEHSHQTQNSQSMKPFKKTSFALSLSAVNSVQSLHSVNKIGLDSYRGDKELCRGDYFASNLFVQQYEDEEEEEEIVCARAHTRCKVLKIARDDFVLIMSSNQDQGMFIHDDGVLGDDKLPNHKTWKHQIPQVSLSDFIEKDVLGVGSFGKVTLVQHKENGKTFALKSVSKYRVVRTGQEEHIINEKRVLTMLDSPFCVKLFGTFKTDHCIYFLTELVLGGELFTVLRYNEKFDKNATRFYAGCVIMALEHLHSMDIIYRDLKPENLLLNSKGYLQLTDFGFAKKRNTTCTLCGTPQYLAPEVIHNWVQSFATDWWALGVLLYEMVVGHAPFEDDENIKMYEKILVHEPSFPSNINSKLRHLIQKLLDKNAYQRLGSGATGARQVKNHPFFKNKLNFYDLYKQRLEAPYKPKIKNNFDTSNFDQFSDFEESEPEEDDEFEIHADSPHYQWVDQF